MTAILVKRSQYFLASPLRYSVVSRLLSSETGNGKEPITIGFIGLGNMGGPMAQNLIKGGYKLLVNDVVPDAVTMLRNNGADVGDTPANIASKTKTIITMLPSSPNVAEVYLGKNGIMETLLEGSLLIDSSTINPDVAKEVALKADEKGATYLDAPVSGAVFVRPRTIASRKMFKLSCKSTLSVVDGYYFMFGPHIGIIARFVIGQCGNKEDFHWFIATGINAAKGGTLSFLVGGSEFGFERAKPIMECMGQNIFYCGDTGTGQAVKLCNNLLLAITMIGTSEAMNLGIKLGLDPKLLAEVINRSTGRCWPSELYNPCPGILDNVPSSNNYQGGFGTALMAKDLGLAQDAATNSKSAIPLGSLAHQIYRLMCNQGYAHLDFSSAFKFLKEDAE